MRLGRAPASTTVVTIAPPSKSSPSLSITSAVKREPWSQWLSQMVRAVEEYSWNSMVRARIVPSAQCDHVAADVVGENRVRKFGFSARSPAIVGDKLHLALRRTGETLEMAALNDAGTVLTQAHAMVDEGSSG